MTARDVSVDATAGTWLPREEWVRTQPRALIGSCVLVHDSGGRVLLLRYGPDGPGAGTWWLPGGMLDHGEDPCTAAHREMCEETGVELPGVPRLIGIDHRVDVGGTGPVLDCYFHGGVLDAGTSIRLSPEHDDHTFADLDGPERLMTAAHAATLRALHSAAAREAVVCLRDGLTLA
ncbi:NUDIX hydrolase [Streptomyces sp. MUSC 14]|uniref:NUDIX hydrolase n=1 Tax=Streptomyces sp. MUSC 14 TaxID=1354889 RepID=UPI0008F591B5|nr:NUDIX hydrolase [Streptomyces sp. MUSC 14]OIJ99332.1 NUDIX hydrolase [Streptomyces sp. MUSC 14]